MAHSSLASLRGQDVGSPEKLITGFAPELFGVPIAEEDVLETASVSKDGHSYYQWCGRPLAMVSASLPRPQPVNGVRSVPQDAQPVPTVEADLPWCVQNRWPRALGTRQLYRVCIQPDGDSATTEDA